MISKIKVDMSPSRLLSRFFWVLMITVCMMLLNSAEADNTTISYGVTGTNVVLKSQSTPIQFAQLLKNESGAGFVASKKQLFTTTSRGDSWNDVTPKGKLTQTIDGVCFLNSFTGWVVVSDPETKIAITSNGGNTWSFAPIPLASDLNYAGKAFPHFIDGQTGWVMLRLTSSSNFSVGRLFKTVDGGESWLELPPPPIGDEITFVNAQEGWLAGGPTGEEFYSTKDGGISWQLETIKPVDSKAVALGKAKRMVKGLPKESSVTQADFSNATEGWLVISSSACRGFKSDCYQEMSLLLTVDGGKTLKDITPPFSSIEQKSYDSVIQTSINKGFDKCACGTINEMQIWYNSSPYKDANVYIGGSSRACSQANLNSNWVSTITSMGWGLIPTWVGPQASCSGFANRISYDVAVARSQGINEASAAANAASSLGFSQNFIIYYDMEHYNSTSTCKSAVNAFLNAWVERLHALGLKAGVYGSPYNATDWATISNPPDAVWIAKWDNSQSVFGLSPLSDIYWTNHQRIHQYQGGHNETWGGITFNIDNNIADGPVVRGNTTTSCNYSISPTSNSVNAGTTNNIVYVNAPGGCNWSATSGTSWIAITAINGGNGNGNVSYRVDANPSTSSRSGNITIAGRVFTVYQAGSSCNYSISPTSQTFGANGGSGSVNVNTGGGCSWAVSSNVSWIGITSGANGNGSGTFNYFVSSNTSTGSRTGTLNVAGQTFTVNQSGNSVSAELILNGGFENGGAQWAFQSGNTGVYSGFSHSGTYYAAGGVANNVSGIFYQNLKVPTTNSTANLSFWLNVVSQETTTSAVYDRLSVLVYDYGSQSYIATLANYSNLDRATEGSYSLKGNFNLLPYAGRNIAIVFSVSTDSILPTVFRVDDVSVR